jgi:hypothetical protein
VLAAAREAKPELANADADVCGISFNLLPNVGFSDDSESLNTLMSPDVFIFSGGTVAATSYA